MNIVKIIRQDGYTSKQNLDRFGIIDCGQGYFYTYKLYPRFSSYPDPYTSGLATDFLYCLLKKVTNGIYKIVAKRTFDHPFISGYTMWLGYNTGQDWILIDEMLQADNKPRVKREKFSNINKTTAIFAEDEGTGQYVMIEPVKKI